MFGAHALEGQSKLFRLFFEFLAIIAYSVNNGLPKQITAFVCSQVRALKQQPCTGAGKQQQVQAESLEPKRHAEVDPAGVSGRTVPDKTADDEWWGSEDEDPGVEDPSQLQPWARRKQGQQGPAGSRVQQHQQQQPQAVGGLSHAQTSQATQRPLEVACVGSPFFRFLRTESAKNTAAGAPGMWWAALL